MSSQSSTRNSAVKSTIKVYSEMKEDKSCKLALRSNQLKVVLATYSIFCTLEKRRNQKLQHYLDVLYYNAPNKLQNFVLTRQCSSTSYLTPPIKKKSVKFQSECTPASCLLFKQIFIKHVSRYFTAIRIYKTKSKVQPIKLLEVLKKNYSKNINFAFRRIKQNYKISKGLSKISFFHKLKTRKFLYGALFKMAFVGEFNIYYGKISLPDQQPQQCFGPYEDDCLDNQIASTKELLAMKFASTAILIGILNQRIIKIQFALLFYLRSGGCKKQTIDKSLDASDVQEYSEEEVKLKPQIIAAHQIFNALQNKFRQSFNHLVQSLSTPSNISIQYYKPPRNSIQLFKQPTGHQKLQAFVKKMFIEDRPKEPIQQSKGIQYVSEYQDASRSQSSSDNLSNTQSAKTMEDSQTTKQIPIKPPQIQAVKKERLNQVIQNYLSPAQVQKPIQKPQQSKKKDNKKIYLILFSITLILAILGIRVL